MAYQYNEESVFNMAIAYLKRIDRLLYMCQKSAIEQNIENWTAHLRGVYREASIRMKETEELDILGDYNIKINESTLLDKFIKPEEANFKNIYYLLNNYKLKIKHKNTIMFLLDCLEVKIRRFLQKQNMLLPSKDDPRKAITQR